MLAGRKPRVVWFLSLVFGLVLPALANPANRIRQVRLSQESGLTVVEIEGDRALNFTTFKQDAPKRVVVDMAECSFTGVPRNIIGDGQLVETISTSEITGGSHNISRVVISLSREVEYRVTARGGSLFIYLTPGTGGLLVSAGIPMAPERVEPTTSPDSSKTSKNTNLSLPMGEEVKPIQVAMATPKDKTARVESSVEPARVEPKPAPTPEPKLMPIVESKPAPAPEPKPVPAVEPKPAPAPEPQPTPAVESKPAPAPQPAPTMKPKLVPTPKPKPEAVAELKPAPVRMPEPQPAPVVEPKPVPARESKPTAVAELKPAPVRIPEPKPTPVVEPKPAPTPKLIPTSVTESKPAPAPVPEPKPTPVVEPKPVPAREPKPTAVAESKPAPVRTPEPQPAPVVEPKPAPTPKLKPTLLTESKPAPAPVPEPKPTQILEPKSVPAPEPKPVRIAQVAPTPKPEPVAELKPVHAPETKTAPVINQKSEVASIVPPKPEAHYKEAPVKIEERVKDRASIENPATSSRSISKTDNDEVPPSADVVREVPAPSSIREENVEEVPSPVKAVTDEAPQKLKVRSNEPPYRPRATEFVSRVGISRSTKKMTWVGFQQTQDSSQVFVKTNEPVRYRVIEESDQLVVLELENTKIPKRNDRRFLDTHFFNTAVTMITPREVVGPGRNVRIEVQLKGRVPYTTGQESNVVFIRFQIPK